MEAVSQIVSVIERVLRPGGGDVRVQLHRPFFLDDFKFYGDPVGYGFVGDFERKVADITRAKYVVAASSGTAALHLAMLACGVGEGDYVGMPSLTFAATAAAVRYCGARPSFGDADSDFGVPVHLMGEPDAAPYNTVRNTIIEDASEAFGSFLYGNHLGTQSDAGVLSFNNNKIITTNGGGAVLTNSAEIADEVRHLATTARDPMRPGFYEHDAVGFNYRMPNICAAVGLWQLRRFNGILDAKRSLYEAYFDAFVGVGIEGVRVRSKLTDTNCWLTELEVPAAWRDPVIAGLQDKGIEARPLFTPLHTQKPYADCPCTPEEAARSVRLFETTVLLPGGMMS